MQYLILRIDPMAAA